VKQRQFLQVVDRDEAARLWRAALQDPAPHDPAPHDPMQGAAAPLGSEVVPLAEAHGRVLARDLATEGDVPGFDRSNMDGWAVRAADTFGANEHAPRRLRRARFEVSIGALPSTALEPGEAMAIPTGGALPRGADAVVLVEATELFGDEVEIRRAVTPGTAVSFAGTDMARGETVLRAGQRLGSRETGVLAAIGHARVDVRKRPRVAILSTGDELVPAGAPIEPGQIYDSNAVALADAVREQGGLPCPLGIVADDEDALEQALRRAIDGHDMVLLSGGTSKGPGDLNVRVLERVCQPPGVVVHGVALKPGKPLCLAASGTTAIAVLPGFPTSAIFTFHELVAPELRRLAGQASAPVATSDARLAVPVRSDAGRTEYNLVRLVMGDDDLPLAYPIGKGSGSVTSWSQADGYFVVPRHTERAEAGDTVRIHALAGAAPRGADLVAIGSHCLGLDLLLGLLAARGFSSKLVAVGSEAGLEAARAGACDLAGVHLLAPDGSYNRHLVDDAIGLVEGYGRMQGVVFRRGDARFEGRDATEAAREAARDPAQRMINRNRGSGTRAHIDKLLDGLEPPDGHAVEASSHHAVAAAVTQRRADWGVAIESVAAGRPLGFLPLSEERYDFLVPRARAQRPAVVALRKLLSDPEVHAALAERSLRR
jgi:putative molybdopterin biosynthesis protein